MTSKSFSFALENNLLALMYSAHMAVVLSVSECETRSHVSQGMSEVCLVEQGVHLHYFCEVQVMGKIPY
jgi:hypothetical protein